MVPEAIVGGYRYSSTNLEIREQSSFITWDRVGGWGGLEDFGSVTIKFP